MTATPPGKPHSPAPSGKGSGSEKRSEEEQTRVFYSRFLGWLVLAIILGYAGLQMPLPWRLLSVAAGLFGVVGGVVLFVQCLRRKLAAIVLIGAVLVTLACGLLLLSASLQMVFWDASAEFEECLRSAVTQRALERCYSDYEEGILSVLPGLP